MSCDVMYVVCRMMNESERRGPMGQIGIKMQLTKMPREEDTWWVCRNRATCSSVRRLPIRSTQPLINPYDLVSLYRKRVNRLSHTNSQV